MTSQTITVLVNGDQLVERDEYFSVNLTGATGAIITGGQAYGTIVDDEPRISINDVMVTEGNTGTVNATFTVSLSAAYGQPVTVHYETADGSATAGSDYTVASGDVTFGIGETSKTITVAVLGDRLAEPTENFVVNLSAPINATIADGQGVGIILDDEPRISINDLTVTEGNTGSINATFTVTLSTACDQDVTFHFDTANGSATAGSDYQAASGTLTIPAGQTSGTITVLVNGDRVAEYYESFLLLLSDPTNNAFVADATGVGTILDDEPSISIEPYVSGAEGNTGTTAFTFTVTLSAVYDAPVTFDYATADYTAEYAEWLGISSATAGDDYTAASGTLIFAAGETSKTITVLVNGDTLYEPDEYFFINLSSPTNAVSANGWGDGGIQNDDPIPPSAVISDVTVTEGNNGAVNATFTVTLSAAYAQPVTVHHETADGSATAGSDYAAASGDVTFAPGETSKSITIAVLGDRLAEPTENFVVNLSAPTNATIADGQGIGTILDDEPRISINDVTVTEGNTGTMNATFTVSLSVAYDVPVTVHYETANGNAMAGSDYAAASGDVTFGIGEISKTITVLANGDLLNEADETFSVILSNPTNATIADGQGVGAILNDDPVPALAISDVTVTEGNAGTVSATFTVSLSAASGQTVTLSYATADGTARAGSDYVAAAGTLTIPAGQTSGTITVPLNGDRVGEPNETFSVNLSNLNGGIITDGQGVGTIVDDEPRISISDVTKLEGKTGQTTLFTFTVTLSAAYDQAVTMSFRTVNGTATSGSDYIAKTGTLTFAPGETTKTITIEVKGDSKREANEYFYLDLFDNSSNSLFTKNRGLGTILNDD